ncbi:hypothetical protein [Amorphus sp. MBR-141]
MTDLSITAANVVASGNARIEHGTSGATITAGAVVYKAAATGKFGLCDSNSGTAEVKAAYGIALNGASDGQPLAVVKKGDVTIGATITAGERYFASETPGGIQPSADLASEDIVFLGIAKSASVLALDIQIPGVTVGA